MWLTDRFGVQIDDVDVEQLSQLLDSIGVDDDTEHASVSLTDADGWNLEFYPDRVLFENVGEDGEPVGVILGSDREERLEMGREFLAGALPVLRTRPWK